MCINFSKYCSSITTCVVGVKYNIFSDISKNIFKRNEKLLKIAKDLNFFFFMNNALRIPGQIKTFR